MRKRLVSMFLLFLGLCLVGCDDSQRGKDEYKLTVIDDFGYVLKPLDEYYKAGEEVELHLAFLSGPSVGININGKYIEENADTKYVGGHPVISFIMPDKDSILYTTRNGLILKDCGDENHQWDEGKEVEGGPGGYVMKYTCKLCGKTKQETISIIPEEKTFYSLQEAFDTGLLTHEDLEAIANINNNPPCVPFTIEPEIEIQIVKDYCKLNYVAYEESIGCVRSFGESDSWYAVKVDGCGVDHMDVITQETIDGVTFHYSTSQKILIWKNNK